VLQAPAVEAAEDGGEKGERARVRVVRSGHGLGHAAWVVRDAAVREVDKIRPTGRVPAEEEGGRVSGKILEGCGREGSLSL
jgi:hypothetical protein